MSSVTLLIYSSILMYSVYFLYTFGYAMQPDFGLLFMCCNTFSLIFTNIWLSLLFYNIRAFY